MSQSSGHVHDLRLAFEQPGCPICQLSRRSVDRNLDILGFESVNDIGLRERIRASRGLCNYHGWQFLDTAGEILGTAIIVRDLLRTLGRETAHLSPDAPDAAFERCLAPLEPCLVCEVRREAASSYAAVLSEQLGDDDFRLAFERSAGLCWFHVQKGVGRPRARPSRQLLGCWRRTAASLLDAAGLGDRVDGQLPRASGVAKGPTERRPIRAGKPLGADPGNRRPRPVAHQMWAACFGEPGLTDDFGEVEPAPPTTLAARQEAPLAPSRECRKSTAGELGVCLVCDVVEAAQRDRQPNWSNRAMAWLCNRHAYIRAPSTDPHAVAPMLNARLQSTSPEARGRYRVPRPLLPLVGQSRLQAGGLWEHLRSWLGIGIGTGRRAESRMEPPCVDCAAQAATEAAAIGKLADPKAALSTEQAQAGLCLVHLRLALASPLPPAVKTTLVVRQQVIWEQLADELGEYIRKQDYRFRDEPRGVEQSAPRRGLEALTGRHGVR